MFDAGLELLSQDHDYEDMSTLVCRLCYAAICAQLSNTS